MVMGKKMEKRERTGESKIVCRNNWNTWNASNTWAISIMNVCM